MYHRIVRTDEFAVKKKFWKCPFTYDKYKN